MEYLGIDGPVRWRTVTTRGPVIDRPSSFAYFLHMSDHVIFFEDAVTCSHCGEEIFGVVFERSGTINCEECTSIIFDARNTGGTVLLLEFEDQWVQ